MNSVLLEKIVSLRDRYKNDGFVIVGIGGSYARNKEQEKSDLDIVYSIDNPSLFASKYAGFGAFAKLRAIKEEIEETVQIDVDLISMSSLNSVGKKYILEDMLYVN